MKKLILSIILIICIPNLIAQTVAIRFDTSSHQAKYAVKILEHALERKGYSINLEEFDYSISILADSQNINPEAYELIKNKNEIIITGGDGRGIIYGAYSIAEDLLNGISLKDIQTKSEAANLEFRGIKFDLPWDTYRHSYALELHQETCAI